MGLLWVGGTRVGGLLGSATVQTQGISTVQFRMHPCINLWALLLWPRAACGVISPSLAFRFANSLLCWWCCVCAGGLLTQLKRAMQRMFSDT
jgi:hypothetical protein